MKEFWNELYGDLPGSEKDELFKDFIMELDEVKETIDLPHHKPEWYKDVVVYSLYVDLFNKDFMGLAEKLDYLQDLGINCLWLLPILDSPMKDAGFDISDYKMIRKDLTGLDQSITDQEHLNLFKNFLFEAKKRNIKVIFDIAINHSSTEHFWFQESRKSPDNPYRDYYIWNEDDKKYADCRLLFKGMCPSNWEKDGDYYFFHRFFEHQPDLNYRNPKVLIEMARNMLFWIQMGVDGFRADAIPYLWKEEGTDCENLPKTHTIVKFFRAVLDHVRPNTLLLAEACQPPTEVVKYFSDENECHAGYHFPLMPQIFKAISMNSKEPIQKTLSNQITPAIPDGCQWFTFLRCHDELSLELVYVSEEDRKYIHKNYCHDQAWDFRIGEGISARLSELMKHDPKKVLTAFSIMLTLPGTPIIYYGDEFGKSNDISFYEEKIKETGHNDTRFLVRGPVDWKKVDSQLSDTNSFEFKVNAGIRSMIQTRNRYQCFGRGEIEWLEFNNNNILSYYRKYKDEIILIIHNLSDEKVNIDCDQIKGKFEQVLLDKSLKIENNKLEINKWDYHWIKVK